MRVFLRKSSKILREILGFEKISPLFIVFIPTTIMNKGLAKTDSKYLLFSKNQGLLPTKHFF
jgi:hypothetical protein